MICQRCQKAQATVHIDEVKAFHGPGAAGNEVEQHHLCEECAQDAQLPHVPVPQKTMDEVWKLLQKSARNAQKKRGAQDVPTCDCCGLTLEQLRRKGRVGCEGCYSTFSQYLGGLLERMHGSVEHVGRTPGVDAATADRDRAIETAQNELDRAVEAEDFERAAELRDQLQKLAAEVSDQQRAAAPGLQRTPEDDGAAHA